MTWSLLSATDEAAAGGEETGRYLLPGDEETGKFLSAAGLETVERTLKGTAHPTPTGQMADHLMLEPRKGNILNVLQLLRRTR